MSHQREREGQLDGLESSFLLHFFQEAVSWGMGSRLIPAFTIQLLGGFLPELLSLDT